tara:strand:- start:223 stop:807 length:585 start_codon:yes stop_codon:yes gene_type:complete
MTPSYFAPISHWKEIINGNILWDLNQNFAKQTIRNRTHIYGPNKILKLSVPIRHSKKSFTLQEALIENDFQWQKDHWKSIESSYKSSPFFQYYEDSLKKLYSNKYEKLSNFNFDGIKLISEWLEIDFQLKLTKSYQKKYETCKDLRFMSEKNNNDLFKVKEYIQVFSYKYGFKNNLSILDLIFNEGPNSLSYLQ